MPKISVIIPVYNVEAYLPRCLDSVFAQSLQDFEAVIVNDGSPDNSQAIIDRYQEKYPDKVVALRQINAGLAAARNTGIDAATGEFLFFLDSDDYLHPDAFQMTYNHAIKQNLDIVCFYFFRDDCGSISPIMPQTPPCKDNVKRYIANEGSACNKLIRASLFRTSGLRFTVGRIYEDLDLIPRLALYTDRIGFLDACLYYYVTNQSSIMHMPKYNPKFSHIYLAADTLKDAFYHTPYVQELEYIYIEHLLHGAMLRYLPFPEGAEDIRKISQIMRTTFPKWRRNPHYRAMDYKYKIICNLAYYRQIRLLKYLLRIH